MATLTPQTVAAAGTAQTVAAATSGGDTVANAGVAPTRLRVVTTSTACTVTIACASNQACNYGLASPTHDVVVVVPTSTTEEIPIPAKCVDRVTGNAAVTYSAVTGVSVGAFQ